MIVTAIDNRLYLVENVLPSDLVKQILNLDWPNLSWNKQSKQEMYQRRSINFSEYTILTEANRYIETLYSVIEQSCNIKFNSNTISTSWWYDEPGFIVPVHTDGHLPCSMQLFWHADNTTLGTKFYNHRNTRYLKYNFPFITNSGYLMINMPESNGSQPLQWHGMLHKVPDNTYRLTSYTLFGSYTDK